MEISKTLLRIGAAVIVVGGLTFGVFNWVYKNKIIKLEESYTAQIYEINKEASRIFAEHDYSVDVDDLYDELFKEHAPKAAQALYEEFKKSQ